MTKLIILPVVDQKRFDSPPKFSADERAMYFTPDAECLRYLSQQHSPTNKVGFLMQWGYFKAQKKYFPSSQFKAIDIKYVTNLLKLDKVNLEHYKTRTQRNHRTKILAHFNWQPLDKAVLNEITGYLSQHAKNQIPLEPLFFMLIDYCWQNKLEVPSYNQIATLITHAYNDNEQVWIKQVKHKITEQQKALLLALTDPQDKTDTLETKPTTLIQLKKIRQSLRPSDIQKSLNAFVQIRILFNTIEPLLFVINLSDQATHYFATWIQKAKITQIRQIPNRDKQFLYLLAYIKDQYYYRQDLLIDIFLKSTLAIKNAAEKALFTREKINRKQRNQAITQVTCVGKESRVIIDDITQIIKSTSLDETSKVNEIETILDAYHQSHTDEKKQALIEMENTLEKTVKDSDFFDALERQSIKLQRRVSSILKVILFNQETSDSTLMKAIMHFQANADCLDATCRSDSAV